LRVRMDCLSYLLLLNTSMVLLRVVQKNRRSLATEVRWINH